MSIIHYGKNDDKNKFICEEGLKDDPLLTLKADEITGSIDIYEEINIGFTLDADECLQVPVVHNCEKLNSEELKNTFITDFNFCKYIFYNSLIYRHVLYT